ncbi:MAG: histidine kinase dimerization/phospho-acceptor domain-containing protein, partial [Gemmatimonadaceae bacterium]
MKRTIRGRLTLWYAGAFAIFLGVFAVAGWVFLDFTTRASVDDYLAETAGAVAGAIEFERGSGRADEEAIAAVIEEFRLRDIDILVLDRMTGVTLSSRLTLEARVPASRFSVAPVLRDAVTLLDQAPAVPAARTVPAERAGIRLFTLPYALGERPLVVGVAQSMAAQERTVHEAEIALALGLPVMLAFASLGGYVLARKSLQPVMDMSERAAAIGASNLHERLPLGNPNDELGRLAALLNDLLGRLERSFEQQRSFMADASHELRTPVAVISAESELALGREDRTIAELRDALGVVRSEGRRMRGIVEDLFLLARADGGERPMRMAPLYLHDLLEECARSATPLATEKRQIFTIALDDDD